MIFDVLGCAVLGHNFVTEVVYINGEKTTVRFCKDCGKRVY